MRVFKSISSFAVLALMGLMLSSGAFAGGGKIKFPEPTGVNWVVNKQVNHGSHYAKVVADWVVQKAYHGDATISASAIGNSFSIEVESAKGCRCPVQVTDIQSKQYNFGDHTAKLYAHDVTQYAGDDAVMAASAVGNTHSIYIGPLDP